MKTSHSKKKGNDVNRDNLALGIFIAVLIVLFITAGFAIKAMRSDIPSVAPSQWVSKWLRDLEAYGKRLLGDRIKVIKPEQKRTEEVQKFIILGYKLHQQNRNADAIEQFNKALQVDPDNPEAFFWRGRTFMKTQEFEKAIADFKRAVEIRPDYREAYDNLGWLFARNRDWDDAILYLTKSIELDPKRGWAYHNRGRSYFKNGNLEKALNDAKKACELGYNEGCKAYETYKKAAP